MKSLFIRRMFGVCLLALLLSFSTSARAMDFDMLNQALDLIHQAWNPGGKPPSNDQRTSLIKQALELTRNAPQHNTQGHRVKAMRYMKAALFELEHGDPDHKVTDYLHDADYQLRTAMSDVPN